MRAPRVFGLSMLNCARIKARWQISDAKFETTSKNVVCRKNSGSKYSILKKVICAMFKCARNEFSELRAFEARWQNFNVRFEFTTKSYPRKLKFSIETLLFLDVEKSWGGHLHTFFKHRIWTFQIERVILNYFASNSDH